MAKSKRPASKASSKSSKAKPKAKPLKTLEKAEKPKKMAPAAKGRSAAASNTPPKAKDLEQKKKVVAKDKKKPKKAKDFDADEDLLPEMEDGQGEEIPDLSDFEEEETPEETQDEELSYATPTAVSDSEQEIILTDAEGRRLCRVRDCDQAAAVEGYCRYHYLLLWKKIQVRRKILADGKLERYVDELTSRYPDKFLEMIKKDLRSEKDFLSAIAELEIDESSLENEFEDETQSFIDEVRGVSGEGSLSDEEEF